ncbi:hypothetical protein [Azospirillum argentinense]|uniref:hypothetical protein n=1 Tax=Azospirillum argentinense TaxID=2970906 RepID=UPI0032E05676
MNSSDDNAAKVIMELMLRVGVMEKYFERIHHLLPPEALPIDVREQIRDQTVVELQKRFPQAGLEYKK